jgi:hypothetical protein
LVLASGSNTTSTLKSITCSTSVASVQVINTGRCQRIVGTTRLCSANDTGSSRGVVSRVTRGTEVLVLDALSGGVRSEAVKLSIAISAKSIVLIVT